MKDGYVKTTAIHDRIRKIEFSHPAHNALPGHLLTELEQAIQDLEKEEEVVGAILCSGGDKTFCAGANFDELVGIRDRASGLAFFSGFGKVINACRRSTKLIIGRIQGKAVGGGVGLAAAVDYCFATQAAAARLSELAIGIGPFVIGTAVKRKIGTSAFSAMALNPEKWYSAEWSERNGLFQEVYADVQSMDSALDTYIRQLSTYHPAAIKALKSVIWEGTENWEELLTKRAEISGVLVLSEFTKNKIYRIQNKVKRQE